MSPSAPQLCPLHPLKVISPSAAPVFLVPASLRHQFPHFGRAFLLAPKHTFVSSSSKQTHLLSLTTATPVFLALSAEKVLKKNSLPHCLQVSPLLVSLEPTLTILFSLVSPKASATQGLQSFFLLGGLLSGFQALHLVFLHPCW